MRQLGHYNLESYTDMMRINVEECIGKIVCSSQLSVTVKRWKGNSKNSSSMTSMTNLCLGKS